MRLASIDIGTNTILLLIADINENGILQPIHEEQQIPRLGKNLHTTKVIPHQLFERTSGILTKYHHIAKQFNADNIIVGATSAVRDASNQAEFVSYIKNETGLDVKILDGESEAMFTYIGARSGLASSTKPIAVLDIGGGSTEITFADNENDENNNLNRHSLPLGCVKLTEKYLIDNPPTPEEIKQVKKIIIKELARIQNPGFENFQLVGVAGTATTLACLDQGLVDFDSKKVCNYQLSQEHIKAWCSRLCSMTYQEISTLSHTTEGRADILTAGALLTSEIVSFFHFPSLLVSERGLRYGLILHYYDTLIKERR